MKHIDTEEEINCHGCPNTHVNTPAGEAFEIMWEAKYGSKPHRNQNAPHFSSAKARNAFHRFETLLRLDSKNRESEVPEEMQKLAFHFIEGTNSGGPR